MQGIKRYTTDQCCTLGGYSEMIEDGSGEYVAFKDYEAEIKELLEYIQDLEDRVNYLQDKHE